ncbi:MAG: hypothetical protein V7767_02505 [Leeuwenhoekiella sp.]
MKFNYNPKFVIVLLLLNLTLQAQVGIGTTVIDDGSALQIDSTIGALVPPRMTESQMQTIPSPLDGSIVYNTTSSSLFLFSSGLWNDLTRPDLPSVVLRKDYASNPDNDIVNTTNNTYFPFPLNTSEVKSIDNSFFQIVSDGTVKILKDGNYMISAGFSVSNLPTGDKKYIIGVYKGNNLLGYLVRGNVKFPTDATNEWGTSGVLVYALKANDQIRLSYVLNNGGSTLDARFFNIGIVKL